MSSELHPGEVRIDASLVAQLVAGQFPQWGDLPIVAVDRSGVDNATYRLGDDLTVRLPRLPRWVGQVAREQRWLPYLALWLPLAVPQPVAQGAPDDRYPFPWSVYRWLDGENATPDRLGDRHQVALDLAGFFQALQNIDATGGPPPEWSNGFRGVRPGDERGLVVPRYRRSRHLPSGAQHGRRDLGPGPDLGNAAARAVRTRR
jgi:aminoglycoside phosphotransferase (APT) family kinase protein